MLHWPPMNRCAPPWPKRKERPGFARKSLLKNWQMKNSHGATVGEKFDPFQRVGAYIRAARRRSSPRS